MEVTTSEDWKRYGSALIQSMQELLIEIDEQARGLILETADYWLSVGLAIGLHEPAAASRLLAVVESDSEERLTLKEDALTFFREAVG